MEEIKDLIDSTQAIIDLAWVQYKPQAEWFVRAFEKEKKPPERDVERLLDGLLDFCFEARFRALFEEVCEAAKECYPQLFEDYKRFLKEMEEGS